MSGKGRKGKASNYGKAGGGGGSTYGSTGAAASQSVYRGVQPSAQQLASFDLGPAQQVLASKGYKVMEMLGAGNYARVFKVRGIDNRDYAVKIIDLDKTSQNYRVKFLPRELQILSSLSHKNIAAIYEILQSGRLIFIFMEFAPNGTIADFLKKFREIPEWMAKPMFAQILEALVYMHALNIAHRDMKLENILLDKHVNPKLTDFSYAIVVQSEDGHSTLSRTFCGSVPYLPPEILQQHPYDPKVADIWSLGVCLFIMLNNTVPFKFNDMAVMLQTQLTRSYKFKTRLEPTFSPQVKEIIKRMLEPDMAQRITAREMMLHPWLQSK